MTPSDDSLSEPVSDEASPNTNLSAANSNEALQGSFLFFNHTVINTHESPSPPDTFGSTSNPHSETHVEKPINPSPACLEIAVEGEVLGSDKHPNRGNNSLSPAAFPKLSASMIIAQQMEAVKGELRWNESQWKVTGELGKGGFGVVYKVRGAGRSSAISYLFNLLLYFGLTGC